MTDLSASMHYRQEGKTLWLNIVFHMLQGKSYALFPTVGAICYTYAIYKLIDVPHQAMIPVLTKSTEADRYFKEVGLMLERKGA